MVLFSDNCFYVKTTVGMFGSRQIRSDDFEFSFLRANQIGIQMFSIYNVSIDIMMRKIFWKPIWTGRKVYLRTDYSSHFLLNSLNFYNYEFENFFEIVFLIFEKKWKTLESRFHDEFKSVFRTLITALNWSVHWKQKTSKLVYDLRVMDRERKLMLPITLT